MNIYINIIRFFPFRKANSELFYINVLSNHPSNIIKKLPNMINKRISDLSCNENEFNKVKPAYETSLRQSGYLPSMQFNSENSQNVRRKRNRKVIWFNPPYSQSVKTNIGKIFIKLVRKHFPKNTKYGKIFNLSTLKNSN